MFTFSHCSDYTLRNVLLKWWVIQNMSRLIYHGFKNSTIVFNFIHYILVWTLNNNSYIL